MKRSGHDAKDKLNVSSFLPHPSPERPRTKYVSIEDVVAALAGECDGARSRDGRGFSRADAQEGGRLSALKRRGWAWTTGDALKAKEICARYAKQAGDILGDGRDAKAQGIEKSLRSGWVKLADVVDDARAPYNYAGFSPGGKRVYLWRMAPIADVAGFRADVAALATLRHGARRVDVEFDVTAEMTVNGERRRERRTEVDFNGTTSGPVLALCARHGFLVEPAVDAPVDAEVDRLRLSERAAWVHRGLREGKKGEWAVFDLARKHEPFSEAVKGTLVSEGPPKRRLYSCDPRDDWNWYLEWSPATVSAVRDVAARFGFAVDREIAATPRI